MSDDWRKTLKSTEIVYSGDRIIQRVLEKLGTTKNIAKKSICHRKGSYNIIWDYDATRL